MNNAVASTMAFPIQNALNLPVLVATATKAQVVKSNVRHAIANVDFKVCSARTAAAPAATAAVAMSKKRMENCSRLAIPAL